MDEKRLKAVPLFAGLSKHERREVARVADEIDVPEGKELVHEGDRSWEVFVIEAGGASVTVDGRRVAELGPGDFFGEMGVIGHRRRNASVVTTSPTTAIVMSSGAFAHIEHELPQVHDRIQRAIEERAMA